MLQKVLQLYASKSLQKRSYAYKGSLPSCITFRLFDLRCWDRRQDYAFILFMSTFHFSGGQVVVPEKFLECVIQGLYFHAEILFSLSFSSTIIISDQWRLCNAAHENEWNKVLLDGLTVGKGDVSPDDLYAVINKRIERVLIRTVRPTKIWILQGAGASSWASSHTDIRSSFLFLFYRKVALTSNAYWLSI